MVMPDSMATASVLSPFFFLLYVNIVFNTTVYRPVNECRRCMLCLFSTSLGLFAYITQQSLDDDGLWLITIAIALFHIVDIFHKQEVNSTGRQCSSLPQQVRL